LGVVQHLSIAQGSLAELQTQLEIAGRLKYLSPEQVNDVLSAAASVARQLHALRNALTKSDGQATRVQPTNPQPLTPNP
jgi:four helix bundle protein